MDEQNKQQDSLDLEEILKEFATKPGEETPEDDVLIWDGIFPEVKDVRPWSPEDTMRLDDVTKAVRQQEQVQVQQGDTVAFTPVAQDETVTFMPVGQEELEQTVTFTPVDQEQPEQEQVRQDQTVTFTPVGQEDEDEIYIPVPPQEPGVEPYSAEWEPEYEQPIGEYVPPEPIVFRPKSRLRELKRKLVAGPEKRYYELTEQGLGKLQAAIFCNLLVAVVAAVTMALFSLGVIPEYRSKFVIFVQFLSLLISALLGSYQMMEGFGDLVRKRFSLNSLLWFSLFACLADSIICLYQVRIPCCAAFSLQMTMSLWSAYHKRTTELGQMDTMRKATRLDSVVSVPDYYDGRPGFLRAEGQVEDFMDHYKGNPGNEKVLSVYAFVALLVSVAIGLLAGILYGPALGVQIFAASLLVSVPASAYVIASRPMAILERRLHKLGTVLCGWKSVKRLSANGMFPVFDEDLFPAGAAKMNGVKFYGDRNPDEVIAYAAALMGACGGGMAPLFTQLLDSRNGHHYEAEELRGYSGGVGAGVNGEAVLAGTLSFMQDMGVDMPDSTRVSQAIYVAIDGQLCGVFALSYQKTKSAARGITTLSAYPGLTAVLVGGDFMMTESFVRSKFGISTHQIAFPERNTRLELTQKQPGEDAKVLALMTQEGLAEAAYAVTGARALHAAMIWGTVIHMIGGILGLVIMLVLSLVGAQYLLTPGNVLLYVLLWMIPGLLITEWTRSV